MTSTGSTSEAASLRPSEIPAAIQPVLADFLRTKMDSIAEVDDSIAHFSQLLTDFVLGGGKRMRPLFGWVGFLAGCADSGTNPATASEDPSTVLRALSSLELIQACALIHDDIIDASDTRRGRPTLHRSIEALHRDRGWEGDPGAYGQSVAILLGDLALAWAEDMLQDSGLSPEALRLSRDSWRGMRAEMIAGQLLDITMEVSGNATIDAAKRVNRFKAAAYTVERPLHLGASIGRAHDETISALRAYGREIGQAFQLRDDLLGVFGDPDITGKPVGDDLREGKRTVLVGLALRRLAKTGTSSSKAQAQELNQGIGTVEDPGDIATLSGIIKDSGAVDELEEIITSHRTAGLGHLQRAGLTPEVAGVLEELAITSTARRH